MLLPTLQVCRWNHAAMVMHRPLLPKHPNPWMPLLTVAEDMPTTRRLVNDGSFDVLLTGATANLEALSYAIEIMDMEGSAVAVIRGSEYAAERIIDTHVMAEVGNRLGTDKLLVGIPRRGLLMAVALDGDRVKQGRLLQATSAEFHGAGNQAISPLGFLLVHGILLGFTDALVESGKEAIPDEAPLEEHFLDGTWAWRISAADLTRGLTRVPLRVSVKARAGFRDFVVTLDTTGRAEGPAPEDLLAGFARHVETAAAETGVPGIRVTVRQVHAPIEAPAAEPADDRLAVERIADTWTRIAAWALTNPDLGGTDWTGDARALPGSLATVPAAARSQREVRDALRPVLLATPATAVSEAFARWLDATAADPREIEATESLRSVLGATEPALVAGAEHSVRRRASASPLVAPDALAERLGYPHPDDVEILAGRFACRIATALLHGQVLIESHRDAIQAFLQDPEPVHVQGMQFVSILVKLLGDTHIGDEAHVALSEALAAIVAFLGLGAANQSDESLDAAYARAMVSTLRFTAAARTLDARLEDPVRCWESDLATEPKPPAVMRMTFQLAKLRIEASTLDALPAHLDVFRRLVVPAMALPELFAEASLSWDTLDDLCGEIAARFGLDVDAFVALAQAGRLADEEWVRERLAAASAPGPGPSSPGPAAPAGPGFGSGIGVAAWMIFGLVAAAAGLSWVT